jgi:hypothetical protein
MDPIIARTHPHAVFAVKLQVLHLARLDPLVPFTGFAKSLLEVLNSLATKS